MRKFNGEYAFTTDTITRELLRESEIPTSRARGGPSLSLSLFVSYSPRVHSCSGLKIGDIVSGRAKRRTRYRKPSSSSGANVARQSVPPYQRTHLSLTSLPCSPTCLPSFLLSFFLSLSLSAQLRLHTRQQDRVSRVTELDGGGVPGTPDHQLGSDSLGQETPGAVGGPSDLGDGVVDRSSAARVSRLQGTLYVPYRE